MENSNNILNICKHENVIKEPQWGWTMLYIYLKSHHGNTIIWIINFVFGIGYITCKVSTTKI
jgi:hypothetical protein